MIPAKDIQDRIVRAVCDLYRHDGDLLNLQASERSITHKLAEHMQRQFPRWDVDCEYNRLGAQPKRIATTLVLPDIIVHRRSSPDNILVIEIKKPDGEDDAADMDRLHEFRNDPSYRYHYGLFLRLGRTSCERAVLLSDEGDKDWTGLVQAALKELGYGG
ncbi:MAG: hypothetical protein COV75_01580 [Candidatus Omnitrophica bacterium CG11_big_fil_rev_8_21_14_0_20_63_9]|nr:MAG: hypothetical protein COV75_01580 [Candidatus Omnitrophica bacterium CG11_big_fil_rev_8_21_14_0_20_63_9]